MIVPEEQAELFGKALYKNSCVISIVVPKNTIEYFLTNVDIAPSRFTYCNWDFNKFEQTFKNKSHAYNKIQAV